MGTMKGLRSRMVEEPLVVFFQFLSITLVTPVILVCISFLCMRDPFRRTREAQDQCPTFFFEGSFIVCNKNMYRDILSTKNEIVHFLFISKTCTESAGCFAMFRKYFTKYNVFVVLAHSPFYKEMRDELTALCELNGEKPDPHQNQTPILFSVRENGHATRTRGLWRNSRMAKLIGFDERNVTILS